MPSEDGSDLVAMIAAEVAKQLPVRQALEPAAVQIGGLGSDLMKCIRLALAPVHYGADLWDRYIRFIERSAAKTAEHDRVEPVPQILGPILEGIRYEPEGSMSDEAFAELLGRAFDRERVAQAHPAFPAIIRVLSDDEMKLLQAAKFSPNLHVGNFPKDFPWAWVKPPDLVGEEFPFLSFPRQAWAYAEHLAALGLLNDLIETDDGPIQFGAMVPEKKVINLSLSRFGQMFVQATFSEQALTTWPS